MNIAEYIATTIDRLPKGYVFTYEDFIKKVNKKEAIIKALNRLIASGKISKLSKGKYYKPEKSAFGTLQPEQYQIVKDLLEQNGKTIGYLTGYSIYNQLGLTTQVSNVIQIGRNEIRSAFVRGRFKISFIKQKNNITKENIPLLQILDAIRHIKKIPDSTNEFVCKRLMAILKKLNEKEVKNIVRLAQKYPPSTRALLGAMLDEIGKVELTKPLLKSLNPITKYKFTGVDKIISNAGKWDIK